MIGCTPVHFGLSQLTGVTSNTHSERRSCFSAWLHQSFDSFYPNGITDGFILFLGNILEGQSGQHIDDAVRELSSPRIAHDSSEHRALYARALEVITRARA